MKMFGERSTEFRLLFACMELNTTRGKDQTHTHTHTERVHLEMFIKNHCIQHEEQDTDVDFLFPNTYTTKRVTGEKADIVSLI